MPFKLIHSNSNGIFKIVLHRNISHKEMIDLCQLATNLVPAIDIITTGPTTPMYGPYLQTTDNSIASQSKLGERPVDKISLGSYKEPDDGVRIKMLHMVNTSDKVPSVKIFRAATDISMLGCKDIVFGNYPCPILKLETAQVILENLRKINVYVKIVPAFDNNRSNSNCEDRGLTGRESRL